MRRLPNLNIAALTLLSLGALSGTVPSWSRPMRRGPQHDDHVWLWRLQKEKAERQEREQERIAAKRLLDAPVIERAEQKRARKMAKRVKETDSADN